MDKKKVLFLMIIILLLTSCSNTKNTVKNDGNNVEHVEEPRIDEEVYVDDNPIKIGFYLDEYSVWNKIEEFYSPYIAIKDINWFNVFLTNERQIPNYGIKGTWQSFYNNYQNIENYRLGYEISFTLNDGTEVSETVLSPKGVYEYKFSRYVYIWVYDDVNQNSSWYTHLEREDFNKNTLMTSIKLMATDLTKKEIASPIAVTVFTYNDDEDFDPYTLKYRGKSKSTLLIKAE